LTAKQAFTLTYTIVMPTILPERNLIPQNKLMEINPQDIDLG